jgi:membrane protein
MATETPEGAPDNPTKPAPEAQRIVLDPESQGAPAAASSASAPGTGGSRLSATVAWLRSRVDTSLGRLALIWFRRYFEASRNSGAAAAAYTTLSVLPTALVIIAIFNLAKGDENAFAERLITHMNLDGSTASLVHDLFGTTSNNLLAASVTVVIGFLVWGLSIGQLYQDLYARAWRIHVGSAADQVLFTIWFFAFSGLVGLVTVSASELRADGWVVVLPAWIVGSLVFWLWTPRFLLHRKISLRPLLPGALLATFVVGGTIATSPLWIGPTLNQNAKAFGSFGVVLGLFAYILIVVTISMVCAVFAPVWAEWRQGEAERRGLGAELIDVRSGQATGSRSAASDE